MLSDYMHVLRPGLLGLALLGTRQMVYTAAFLRTHLQGMCPAHLIRKVFMIFPPFVCVHQIPLQVL